MTTPVPSRQSTSNPLALAGLVLGIVTLLFALAPYAGVPLLFLAAVVTATVGVALSIVGLVVSGKRGGRAIAVWGLVLSAAPVWIGVFMSAAFGV